MAKLSIFIHSIVRGLNGVTVEWWGGWVKPLLMLGRGQSHSNVLTTKDRPLSNICHGLYCYSIPPFPPSLFTYRSSPTGPTISLLSIAV